MTDRRQTKTSALGARLRFSFFALFWADPPANGTLGTEIAKLAEREWRHPVTGEPVRFVHSTIERWLYLSRRERQDPVGVLRRKPRHDAGHQASMTEALRRKLQSQYAAHPSWSAQLHRDNLEAAAKQEPDLRPVPSYSTIRRYLRAKGLDKRRRVTSRRTAGALVAEAKLASREIRSYEAEYTGSLWHWDCQFVSRKVLTARGEWQTPVLFGVLDDRSRLACHQHLYLSERAEKLRLGRSPALLN